MEPRGPPLPTGRRAWRTPASQRWCAAEGVSRPKLDNYFDPTGGTRTLAPGFTSGAPASQPPIRVFRFERVALLQTVTG
jgi:hypothetical protein